MIPIPLQPKIIEKKENWARFKIEALYPGYGVTIGNSLRRVLLSSLPGAAVTQMKIKGVPHEFSTIPGVTEDAILIMLNLKQLRFRIYVEEPQKARLIVKGEKEVKASDFELPAQVELINKDAHIATLTAKSAELDMEIQIEKGIGYLPREAKKKPTVHTQTTVPTQEKLEIGVIPLDAVFTPVRRVSYKVENMRVGERTDFDRLFLEIKTDGTITPEAAFFQASEILVKHFSLFTELPKEAKVEKRAKPSSTTEALAEVQKKRVAKRAPTKKIKRHAKTKKGKKAK